MLLKTYSLSLRRSKYCCRSELFENVYGAGRQSLELLLVINTMVTPSGLIPDQVCTVAETVHAEHRPALGELQAHLLSWKVQQK